MNAEMATISHKDHSEHLTSVRGVYSTAEKYVGDSVKEHVVYLNFLSSLEDEMINTYNESGGYDFLILRIPSSEFIVMSIVNKLGVGIRSECSDNLPKGIREKTHFSTKIDGIWIEKTSFSPRNDIQPEAVWRVIGKNYLPEGFAQTDND